MDQTTMRVILIIMSVFTVLAIWLDGIRRERLKGNKEEKIISSPEKDRVVIDKKEPEEISLGDEITALFTPLKIKFVPAFDVPSNDSNTLSQLFSDEEQTRMTELFTSETKQKDEISPLKPSENAENVIPVFQEVELEKELQKEPEKKSEKEPEKKQLKSSQQIHSEGETIESEVKTEKIPLLQKSTSSLHVKSTKIAQDETTVSENELMSEDVADDSMRSNKDDINRVMVEHPVMDDSLVSIYIMSANEELFGGNDLLQTILANGFEYGDMQIFHHYKGNGSPVSGEKLYSLVSASEPGEFNINKMNSFTTNGLIIFMDTYSLDQPVKIFNSMLSTAKQLAEDLDGELRVDRRHPLTPDKISEIQSHLLN